MQDLYHQLYDLNTRFGQGLEPVPLFVRMQKMEASAFQTAIRFFGAISYDRFIESM